jgi:hypothetical protein
LWHNKALLLILASTISDVTAGQRQTLAYIDTISAEKKKGYIILTPDQRPETPAALAALSNGLPY